MQKPVTIMPWKKPDPFKPLLMQDKAAFQKNLLDHCANFDVDSPVSPIVLSTVVCTLGERCIDKEVMIGMMENGFTVARIDMSVGDRQDHEKYILLAREAVNEYTMRKRRVYPLTVALDLKGPEILTGGLINKDEKISLVTGEIITLTTHPGWDTKGNEHKLFVDHRTLQHVVSPGDRILLDYGRIELRVRGTVDNDIVCEIVSGGDLGEFKSVVVPGVALNIPAITPKDKKDILLGINYSVDAIFMSYVRSKSTVDEFRNFLGDKGKSIMLFSKIECRQSYNNFDSILEESDGIVINRASMSVEMSTEKVLQAQRTMIAKCIKAGKPVLTSAEFLNSMIHKTCPTIAEVTDVASTVIDGADGIILNQETAQADFPILTVRTLATLCREAEAEVWAQQLFYTLNEFAVPPVDPSHAISIAAVEASLKAHTAAILVVTTSGRSAQLIAKYRPRCPVLAITRYGAVSRKLNMWRGIIPIHYIAPPQPCWNKDVDLRMQYAIEYGKTVGIIKPGDALILINGWRQGAGFTNNFRFVYASNEEPWVLPSPSPFKGR